MSSDHRILDELANHPSLRLDMRVLQVTLGVSHDCQGVTICAKCCQTAAQLISDKKQVGGPPCDGSGEICCPTANKSTNNQQTRDNHNCPDVMIRAMCCLAAAKLEVRRTSSRECAEQRVGRNDTLPYGDHIEEM